MLAVEEYCEREGIPFNILLDNAPGRPQCLRVLHPNVHIELFPPRATAIPQPMNQEVMKAFNASHINRTFNMIHNDVLQEEGAMVAMFWRKFHVSDAIKLIKKAWDSVKQSMLSNAWKKKYAPIVNVSGKL